MVIALFCKYFKFEFCRGRGTVNTVVKFYFERVTVL